MATGNNYINNKFSHTNGCIQHGQNAIFNHPILFLLLRVSFMEKLEVVLGRNSDFIFIIKGQVGLEL